MLRSKCRHCRRSPCRCRKREEELSVGMESRATQQALRLEGGCLLRLLISFDGSRQKRGAVKAIDHRMLPNLHA